MPAKPVFYFFDEERKIALEPLCSKVIERFELPNYSVACIFDDREREAFSNAPEFGEYLCGFFRPVRAFGTGSMNWPQEILEILRRVDQPFVYGKDYWLFDTVIYVRRRICQSEVGAMITFAHELTHLIQYGFHRKIRLAEKRVFCGVYDGPPMAPWLLPTEHDAQLNSKRVADVILGGDRIEAYAAEQIEQEFDPEKWRFFLELDIQESFDLTREVDNWVRKYKAALIERFPAASSEEPDFTRDNWWE